MKIHGKNLEGRIILETWKSRQWRITTSQCILSESPNHFRSKFVVKIIIYFETGVIAAFLYWLMFGQVLFATESWVWRVLTKLKIELPRNSVIPFLGICLEKTIIWKDACTPVFTAVLFTVARTQKQPKCSSTVEWIKKIWSIHTHTHTHTWEYYSVIKRNEMRYGWTKRLSYRVK